MDHMVFISHSSADRLIANGICNHLESNGIRCWIAPRDITTTDWADSIMDGLRRSDVFVVIISEHSINSQEVTKEVTEATHTCEYILPFKVDKQDLNPRLRYHLGPCHWLDAVTPPLEQRFIELEQRIRNLAQEDSVYLNQYQRKLVERIVWPRSLFVGRDEEIAEIADRLEEDHILFLQGMGGIGKSEIAKAYAKTYRDRYDTIIFAGYTSSLLELVTGDAIPIENLRRGSAETESPEAFFARKLEILHSLSSERTLLIIDNFDVDGDPHLEALASGPYHLLITTRNEHEDYPMMRIGRIKDFDQVRHIFTTNYGKKLGDEDLQIVDRILNLVGCHTITVELIAKQMKASRRKPAEMLALLQNTGTNTKLKEKIKHSNTDSGLSSFDYIRQMFQISGLSEEEKHLLCCMSLLPYTGIDISRFYDFCKLESYDDINSLLAKSWLMLDEDTDILSLHPVICDVIKAEFAPTPLSCIDYVMGLWDYAKNAWWYTVEQREEIAPLVAYIQDHYPEPVPELCTQYGDFVNIAWICGDFPRSQKSGHAFYDFCLKHYGPNTAEAGTAAMYLAGAYHNSGDDISAEPFYLEGLNHRLASLPPTDNGISTAYSKLGRCAYKRGDYEASMDYLTKAMDIFNVHINAAPDEAGRNLALFRAGDTIVELERLYMCMEDYETALTYCHQSYEAFLHKDEGQEVPNSAYSLVDLGICHSKLGNYQKASEYLQRALDLNIKFNGVASVQTARTKEAIADNAMAMGDTETASRLYLQLELDLERDFGPTNPQVIQLRKKRENMEA